MNFEQLDDAVQHSLFLRGWEHDRDEQGGVILYTVWATTNAAKKQVGVFRVFRDKDGLGNAFWQPPFDDDPECEKLRHSFRWKPVDLRANVEEKQPPDLKISVSETISNLDIVNDLADTKRLLAENIRLMAKPGKLKRQQKRNIPIRPNRAEGEQWDKIWEIVEPKIEGDRTLKPKELLTFLDQMYGIEIGDDTLRKILKWGRAKKLGRT